MSNCAMDFSFGNMLTGAGPEPGRALAGHDKTVTTDRRCALTPEG
jgi:hypothetical protein